MTRKLLVMFTFSPCNVDTDHLYGVIVPLGKGELKHKLEVGGLNLHSYVASTIAIDKMGLGFYLCSEWIVARTPQVPFKQKQREGCSPCSLPLQGKVREVFYLPATVTSTVVG